MGEGTAQEEYSFWLVDLASGSEEIIAMIPSRTAAARPDTAINSGFQVDLPFEVRPSAAAGFEFFYLTNGRTPAIQKHDGTGRLHTLIRVRRDLEPVTIGDYEQAIEDRALEVPVLWAAALRRVLREAPVAETKPVWERLVVDAEGYLWAEAFRTDSATRSVWTVFAADGAALGTVDLPPDLHVMQIGSDFVLGRWRDPLGSQHVRRYVLRR